MRLTEWTLDPDVVHLNHGSFGGSPRVVTDAAVAIRARLDASPMRFYLLEWQAALDRAREALAAFVGADPARVVYLPSPTTGVAIALRSLGPIARVLVTDHTYRACKNQLDRSGAAIDVVPIVLPFDRQQLIDDLLRAVRPDTRLALLDHITSPTALRLPVEDLVPLLRARGVATIVDGAHAPGQIELAIDAIGADYYVGSCHKWLCAPRGSAFIALGPEAAFTPIVTSHGASAEYGPANRLHAELDWPGTHDPTAYLAVPTALAFFDDWAGVRARNHATILAMRERIGGRALAPDDALGAMVAMPIETSRAPLELQMQLLRDGFEVPIVARSAMTLLRLSAHAYNDVTDVDALAERLRALGVNLL